MREMAFMMMKWNPLFDQNKCLFIYYHCSKKYKFVAPGFRGLDIWCIVGGILVPVAKSLHGKFYTGSSYTVLNVSTSTSTAVENRFLQM
jgi:hypothetical protein